MTPTHTFDDAAAYERYMTPWSRSAGAVFLEWLGAAPGLSWLDVGCGNGAFTEMICTQAAPSCVCAVDPSGAQVTAALTRLAARPVSIQVGDAMALPYGEERFDVSVMALVLFFVPDPRRAVAEMVRVTKPGGLIASYTWDVMRGGLPGRPLGEELRAMGKSIPRPPSSEVSRIEALKALWAEFGLCDIGTCEIVVARTFTDFGDYWRTMVESTPTNFAAQLTSGEIDELKSRLEARLPTSSSGEITHHATATAVQGRKPR
jgi:SAM-dependent methyltransferase